MAKARADNPGLPDLLPYQSISGNRITLKSGDVAHCFELEGVDPEVMSNAEINRLHQRLHVLLNALPMEAVRYQLWWMRSDRLNVSDHIPELQASERVRHLAGTRRIWLEQTVQQGELFAIRIILAVLNCFKPGGRSAGGHTLLPCREAVAEQTAAQIEGLLAQAGFAIRPMAEEDCLKLVWCYLNPDPRVPMPPTMSGRDVMDLPSMDMCREWTHLRLGSLFLGLISLRRLPDTTVPGMFRILSGLSGKMWCVVNMVKCDRQSELTRLKIRRNLTDALSLRRGQNIPGEIAVEESLGLEKDLTAGNESVFLAEWLLVLTGDSQAVLDQKIRAALGAFHAMNGAEGFAETAASLKLWVSGLLGCAGDSTDFRFHRLLSRNLADLLPVFAPDRGIGPPVIVFGTKESTLNHFNPFDWQAPNYNSLVFGSSGGGKSFFVQYLCMQLLTAYPGMSMVFVDKGGSYGRFVEAFGGRSVTVTHAGNCAVNPLGVPDVPRARPYLEAVIGAMIREKGATLSNDEKVAIGQALDLALQKRVEMTLPNMVGIFRGIAQEEGYNREISARISRHLERWTRGLHGSLFAGKSSSFLLHEGLTAIDLKGLEPYPEILEIFLLYITELIWAVCEYTPAARKIIVFDEVWSVLATDAGGRLVAELYRTLRKYGAGIITVSQSLDDFRISRHEAGIMSNVETVFVLKQAATQPPGQLRQALNLTEGQLEAAGRLGQIKGVYADVLVAGSRSFVARVRPTPMEYWMATSDPKDRLLLEQASQTRTLWDALCHLSVKYPKGAE